MQGSGRSAQTALFTALVVAWGLNYIFVREGLAYSAPIWLAFLRSSVGALGTAVIVMLARPGTPLDRRAKRDALLLGIPNTTLFFGLWFAAAGSVLPGIASVVVYTFPLWVALLSGPVLGHRLSAGDWIAVGGGFLGVVLIARPWEQSGGTVPVAALLELLGGALSWAVGTVYFQRRFPPTEMVEASFYQLLGGSGGLAVAAFLVERASLPAVSVPLVEIVLWLGLVGTAVGYAIWFWLLGRTRAAQLSAYVFLVPVVALVASALVFGERLDLAQIVGVALVLVALYAIGVHRRTGGSDRVLGSPGSGHST